MYIHNVKCNLFKFADLYIKKFIIDKYILPSNCYKTKHT